MVYGARGPDIVQTRVLLSQPFAPSPSNMRQNLTLDSPFRSGRTQLPFLTMIMLASGRHSPT